MQLLCMLRNHCRQWPRNTRYQAGATRYLGRTFTGWIAPACGWRTYSVTSSGRVRPPSTCSRKPYTLGSLAVIANVAIRLRRRLHAPSTGMQPRDRPRALLGGRAKRCGSICGICLAPGFYVCAMAIFEVMLALTFPSLRSVARCAPMAAFNLRCVLAGNVARDGASGVAARALAA
jgi:hypothetical protein